MYARYMSIIDCAMMFEPHHSIDSRYVLVKNVFIHYFLELSVFVDMLVRIWKKAHAIACMTQQGD